VSRPADPLELLSLATSVTTEAGRLLEEAQRGRIEVADTKSSPTDVVTAVDLRSEELIRKQILTARPDDGFVGEEGDDLAGSSGVTWVADPIDGTVNFLYKIPQFAVSLAAVADGETLAGVVLNPVSGEMFTAARGDTARLDGEPIRVSRRRDVSQALVGTGYHYRADVREVQGMEQARLMARVRDLRRMGSAALDLCFVACGRFDAYVERGLKPWDLAAGRLIVTQAGGRVEGMNGDEPGELVVVAASGDLFPAFHDELAAAGFDAWPLTHWP